MLPNKAYFPPKGRAAAHRDQDFAELLCQAVVGSALGSAFLLLCRKKGNFSLLPAEPQHLQEKVEIILKEMSRRIDGCGGQIAPKEPTLTVFPSAPFAANYP